MEDALVEIPLNYYYYETVFSVDIVSIIQTILVPRKYQYVI